MGCVWWKKRSGEGQREGGSQLGSLGNNVKRSPRSFGEEAGPRSRLGIWLGREDKSKALLVKTCWTYQWDSEKGWMARPGQAGTGTGDAQRGGRVSDKGECGRLREYSRKGSNMIYLTFADYFGCCVGDRIQKIRVKLGGICKLVYCICMM